MPDTYINLSINGTIIDPEHKSCFDPPGEEKVRMDCIGVK